MQFTSNLYARYYTGASHSDGARVAKFEVEDGFATSYNEVIQLTIKPGDVIELPFIVNNKGETAINFIIEAENLTNNLPVSFDAFSQSLAAGASANYNFIVRWVVSDDNKDWQTSPEHANKTDYVRLSIRIEQAD